MVPCILDLSYYTPAEITATNEPITTIMLEFVAKAMDNENKHLWRYAVCLMDDLEPL